MVDLASQSCPEQVIHNRVLRSKRASNRSTKSRRTPSTWPREANGRWKQNPDNVPPVRRDRRPLWKRILDEVIAGLGGEDKVPPHLRRVAKLYARIQAEIEHADLSTGKLTRMIGNAARLRRQMGLDVPLKRLPRVDRDQSYRDYFSDGDAVEPVIIEDNDDAAK